MSEVKTGSQNLPPGSPALKAENYFYELPVERIAMYPEKNRDDSKLLIYNKGIITENRFLNIAEYLPAGSHLVLNNSRVINARLIFKKESGSSVEILCLEPVSPSGYSHSLSSRTAAEWKCMVGNLRKWKTGILKSEFSLDGRQRLLHAEKKGREDSRGICHIEFRWDDENLTFGEVLNLAGHIPLPPYIGRNDEPSDAGRYQTVYSRVEGSVAAPTAGLHFTPQLFERLREKKIGRTDLTLHVGAGTFLPVKSNNILEHEMHGEVFSITAGEIEKILSTRGKIIAVGTTSLRALESLYLAGAQLKAREPECESHIFTVGQWEGYSKSEGLTLTESLKLVLEMMQARGTDEFTCLTRLMIIPGFKFMVPDMLITNFHLPGSTLMMLVAAWAGDDWKRIYNYALGNDFRFLSYGDSSLLIREKGSL